MTDNEKKRDEDLQRAAEEFFAAKVSQGYTPEQAALMLHEGFQQVRRSPLAGHRSKRAMVKQRSSQALAPIDRPMTARKFRTHQRAS